MNLTAPLTELLTLQPRSVNSAGTSRPGVLAAPRRYLWYYEVTWPDGSLAASLHLGEGIVPAGERLPWRIMRRDRSRTLLAPAGAGTMPIASYYPGGTGINGEFFRVTEGDSRIGGFDIYGNGWRGGVVVRRDTKERCLLLRGDGDPPDVYYIEPLLNASALPSVAAMLLLSYVLTEREVSEGNWIKRPGQPNLS